MRTRGLLLAAGLSLLAACEGTGRLGAGPGDMAGVDAGAGPAGSGAAKVTLERVTIDSGPQQALLAPMPPPADATLPDALVGYVAGSTPDKLVVMCHGLNQDAPVVWRDHVLRTVDTDVAVIATNYRDNEMFPIGKGAVDTVAATQLMLARFPSIERVYLFGVSMGGAVSGTAITESALVSADGQGLYDHWIAVEPLVMLVESYYEASAALPEIAREIEHDAGGTPEEVPDEYRRRTAVANVPTMAAQGLRTITIVHAFNDGLVPYNQARELASAAVAAAIPVQLFSVARKEPDQDSGTTGSGSVFGVLGIADPLEPLNLAGHGWEGDPEHPVMRTAFEQLQLLLDGEYDEALPYNEALVDDG